MGPGLVVLSSYFNKRRGFANSISTVGGSIGSLVFPKIIQILIETYGLQGALLMVAGILNYISIYHFSAIKSNIKTRGVNNIEKLFYIYVNDPPLSRFTEYKNVRDTVCVPFLW
jgi:sugar phosphate permease